MTNEAIRARMWEAYKAGMLEGSDLTHVENPFHREQFLRWLNNPDKGFPELYCDGWDGESNHEYGMHPEPVAKPYANITPRVKRYYHNFGCTADTKTPNGEGICICDGSDDPTL